MKLPKQGWFLPLIALSLASLIPLAVVLTGAYEIAWRPPILSTTNYSSNGAIEITSVAGYSDGLFVAGYDTAQCGLSASNCTEASDVFFLKRFDSSDHEIWTRTFGNQSGWTNQGNRGLPSISLGPDGVYMTAEFNGKTRITKFNYDGNRQWSFPVNPSPQSNTPVAPRLLSGLLYVAGSRQYQDPSEMYVSGYDTSGTGMPQRTWSHIFANSTGNISALSASSYFVYVAGSLNESLPGKSTVSIGDGFLVTSLYNGTQVRADEFGHYGGVIVTDVGVIENNSVGAQGVYVVGTGGLSQGFVRIYNLNGTFVREASFSLPVPGGVGDSRISIDTSGIYVLTNGYVVRLDLNGNEIWNLPLDTHEEVCLSFQGCTPIGVKQGAVYIGGKIRDQRSTGFVQKISQTSSLIMFGVNPPISFLIAAAFPAAVVITAVIVNLRQPRKKWALKAPPAKKRPEDLFAKA